MSLDVRFYGYLEPFGPLILGRWQRWYWRACYRDDVEGMLGIEFACGFTWSRDRARRAMDRAVKHEARRRELTEHVERVERIEIR